MSPCPGGDTSSYPLWPWGSSSFTARAASQARAWADASNAEQPQTCPGAGCFLSFWAGSCCDFKALSMSMSSSKLLLLRRNAEGRG